MTITYHSGERIQATAADFAGIPAISGGWKEVGRTTLGSANSSMDVTSLPDKRYYMVLTNGIGYSGVANTHIRFNSDSGANYGERVSINGGTDSYNSSGYNFAGFAHGNSSTNNFGVGYVANKSDKEKLAMCHNIRQNSAGASNAPIRTETVAKWSNTSSAISGINCTTAASSTHGTGSETVILGWDEDDTHTDNFWEELASVELSSAGDNLSSGTITAKKYLWVQAFMKNTGGNTRLQMSFNNDTGNNIAERGSSNGGTDWTATNASVTNPMSATTDNIFINYFIINNSSNEKLGTGHIVRGSGGAGTAPSRVENVFKWVNTSSQITEIDIDNDQAGSFDSGSFIKVWGSN